MRFGWLAAFAAGSFLFSSGPASAQPLSGHWVGTVRQGDGQTYPVVMRIGAQGGTIAYPRLNCGGRLIPIRRWSRSAIFRERITYGRESPATGEGCVDRGLLRVWVRGGEMIWEWRAPSGETDLAARATLRRR